MAAGAGAPSSLPGGTEPGVYLYEYGDTVSISATDIDPTPSATGSRFDNWTSDYGDPGAGFDPGAKNTSVTISGDLSVSVNFPGKYMIVSVARVGGTITPLGQIMKFHGESQTYNILANTSYINSDVVVDNISQGAQASFTFNNLSTNHRIVAVFVSESDYIDRVTAGDDQIYRAAVPPMVLMVMGRDHKL